ncbi:MAG TPA: class I SAM-dependent methyltransferase [Gammaproteobacteria bacterium]|nr:class I SAM-dependent methyltransferase [Gammaproteobacteria bacterium]
MTTDREQSTGSTGRQEHWNQVYRTKATDNVSWYQTRPETSLSLIAACGLPADAAVIDVGGGASVLADCLLDAGFTSLAVLDISGVALAHARTRLGDRARGIEWLESDVTAFKPARHYALWHDRAVFHFLTTADDRRRYLDTLCQCLEPEGHVIIATFATDGPEKCSGLDVRRYDEAMMQREFGTGFRLIETRRETHLTPWQSEQRFIYFRFQRQF